MQEAFSIHVEGLTAGEVMQSMRRMMLRPYLLLWAAVYVAVGAVAWVQRSASLFTLLGPAVILILLALAYEFSGRKNYSTLQYAVSVIDYAFSPDGYSITVGTQTEQFSWADTRLRRTRSDFLLYSDKQNSSVLPLRCLSEAQKKQILAWAKA